MRRYGLIGYPLGHSFSEKYFSEKFKKEGVRDARYDLYPIPSIEALPGLLRQTEGLSGLNVTVPYKVAVLPLLDEVDDSAAEVGAVNTISIDPDGYTKGYNTDVYGFRESLVSWMPEIESSDMQALVFGTGGAARAVCHVLSRLGIGWTVVSRTPQKDQLGYEALEDWISERGRALLINTTPVGMYPDTGTCLPIPWNVINDRYYVFDLIYNPAETLLLQRASVRGAAVKNGLEMLHLQAERAWSIWQSV